MGFDLWHQSYNRVRGLSVGFRVYCFWIEVKV